MIGPRADVRGASADPWIGRVLEGKYQLLRPMGEGGMGTVYEGLHVRLRKRLAIKLLHPHLARDAKALRRFEAEARAAAEVVHPGIVEVLDFGETEEDTYFLVMELLEGHDLEAEIRHGPLSVSRATTIAREVCSALEAIHARGIVHRDLKPANVFLERDGETHRVKVLDFGIAKLTRPPADLETAHTVTGMAIGTPVYMSPEQARGMREVDHRTDLYALGVILFEALTGTTLFAFNNLPDLLLQICHGTVPRLRERRPDLPEELDAVVHRMVARKAADRFATAAEVADALAPFATEGLGPSPLVDRRRSAEVADDAPVASTLLDPSPPSPPPSPALGASVAESIAPSPPTRSASRWAVGLGVLLVLGLAGAAALSWRPSEGEPPAPAPQPAAAHEPPAPPEDPPARGAVDPAPPPAEPGPLAPPPPVEAVVVPPPRVRRRAAPVAVEAPPLREEPSPPLEVTPTEPPAPAVPPPSRDIFRLPVP